MCADNELYSNLFLFIHITSKVFHSAHFPLILERISQVASTGVVPLPKVTPEAVKEAAKLAALSQPVDVSRLKRLGEYR